MPKARILVIDDEPSIIKLVTAYLKAEDYEYQSAADGVQALKVIHNFRPDVVILDIMLPGIDGIEVLNRLRRESDAYVILLSAKSEEMDKLVGLAVGADDYLTKPFSPKELMARINAALRRMTLSQVTGEIQNKIFTFNHIRIDLVSRRVWVDDNEKILTALEFDLLLVLAHHHAMVLSRPQILEKVWGYDYFGDLRVVDVHIGHLRAKIGPHFITTLRGVGYRFEDRD